MRIIQRDFSFLWSVKSEPNEDRKLELHEKDNKSTNKLFVLINLG